MAIIFHPQFPAPNRSKQRISQQKDADGVIDIGWCEGVLSDGRPFRAETWAQDQTTIVTIFFSATGLSDLDGDALRLLLETERLVVLQAGQKYLEARRHTDDAGSEMWSVNVVIGADDEIYASCALPCFRYVSSGEPPTLFKVPPTVES